MTTVFADTSFFVCLVGQRDALHERATAFFRNYTGADCHSLLKSP
jgi:hypothetical protein